MNKSWFEFLINEIIDKIDNNIIDIIFSGNKEYLMISYDIINN